MTSSIITRAVSVRRKVGDLSPAQRVFLTLVLVFIVSRLVIVGISCIGYNHFQLSAVDASWNDYIRNLWGKWDVGWYKKIAAEGYEHAPFSAETYQNWGFLPLYPLLVKALQWLFHTNKFFLVGSAVSCLMTFFALLIVSNVFKDRIQNPSRFFFLPARSISLSKKNIFGRRSLRD
jgi:hypothetical protein